MGAQRVSLRKQWGDQEGVVDPARALRVSRDRKVAAPGPWSQQHPRHEPRQCQRKTVGKAAYWTITQDSPGSGHDMQPLPSSRMA